MQRLRSDFWVSAHLRRCAGAGIDAVLRRRGADEAGAIFVSVDRLDGAVALFGPVPQMMLPADELARVFSPVLKDASPLDIEARMTREIGFDPDLWWVAIDDREGRSLLTVIDVPG